MLRCFSAGIVHNPHELYLSLSNNEPTNQQKYQEKKDLDKTVFSASVCTPHTVTRGECGHAPSVSTYRWSCGHRQAAESSAASAAGLHSGPPAGWGWGNTGLETGLAGTGIWLHPGRRGGHPGEPGVLSHTVPFESDLGIKSSWVKK